MCKRIIFIANQVERCFSYCRQSSYNINMEGKKYAFRYHIKYVEYSTLDKHYHINYNFKFEG